MKVKVDMNLCVGHGRCYDLAPEIFDEDEAGYCVLKLADVPSELEDQAWRAEANCPENAIQIEQAKDGKSS